MSANRKGFDWVLFDAGGTLLGTNTGHEHWYEQFFVEACAEQGSPVGLPEVHQALLAAIRTCDVAPRCSTPGQVRAFWEHIYGGVFRALVPGCDPDAVAAHYIDRFETGEFVSLFPDALPALEAVRASGAKAAVVSNFGTYLELFLERCGIAHYFDFVIISAAAGCEKPHPEIFDLALERTGSDPCRIMFVGDNPSEDYEASERHGFFPVLVDRHDKHASKAHLRRVRQLDGIAQYLNGR